MKTLTEQVNEIVNGNGSKTMKSISLVKLGLTPYEIKLMLGDVSVSKKTNFNANLLTFGVEIECYNVTRARIINAVSERNISILSQEYNHRNNKSYYKIVNDSSIHGNDGQEIVSPILKGKEGLNSLKNVCEALNSNIFKNYQKLEHIIDSFMPNSRKCSMGWFFGFKLHLICNECGELLNFMITPGDVYDRKHLEYKTFVEFIYRKLVGDKGYISKNLFKRLFVDGIQLITKLKSNMKGTLMSVSDKLLLRKRAIIETVNDELKNIAQAEHS